MVTASLGRYHCGGTILGNKGFTQLEKRQELPEFRNTVFLKGAKLERSETSQAKTHKVTNLSKVTDSDK